ncbi:right-handed parallel beta-helix repeat-containing protein [Microbacterium sp. ZW T5_45]|uniref:right-handed parallel beta-helix repeat-containing protein n=1 Tax=Microbacterium sp. ZW T5_45 TaxID=3378080 RepID=UPI003854363C
MKRAVPALIVTLLAVASLVACSPSASDTKPETQDVVRVPADASLTDAGALVADGGIILISSGTYTESLDVRADDVTVRGEDRNGVILDGELTRSNGVVATGERITVENLTVRNFLQNGVLITGVTDENGAGVARGPDGYLPDQSPPPVPGYLVQSVTANNNGLYGIYAFNRTDGVIQDNIASGGSDSGIYVGQCEECNALVQNNVITMNAAGLELANASAVTVTGNRIVDNRIGISVLSNYLEAHGPTAGVQIVGNVISDNNAVETPEQAGGAFGVGIGLGGTVDAVVRANLITGNSSVGVWVTSSEDFAPTGTSVSGDAFSGNALDIAFAPSATAPGADNCFDIDSTVTVEPAGLSGCATTGGTFVQPSAPAGIMFSKVAFPAERPGLDSMDDKPRTLPATVEMPDLSTVEIPAADMLADPIS